jgi:hypothetical protein
VAPQALGFAARAHLLPMNDVTRSRRSMAKARAQAKIGQLEVTISINQNIVRLSK